MEIGQADFNHPVQPLDEGLHQHAHRRSVIRERTSRAAVSSMPHTCPQWNAADFAAQGRLVQPLPVAVGTLHFRHQTLGLLLVCLLFR